MTDAVEHVLAVSNKLQSLRQRLDELDAERAVVKEQIDVCMRQLAATAGTAAMPSADDPFADQVRWVLRQHRDHALGPADIARILNLTTKRQRTNMRVLLSRMGRDGRARRVEHGRYMTVE